MVNDQSENLMTIRGLFEFQLVILSLDSGTLKLQNVEMSHDPSAKHMKTWRAMNNWW
jgi:hypothetical protein